MLGWQVGNERDLLAPRLSHSFKLEKSQADMKKAGPGFRYPPDFNQIKARIKRAPHQRPWTLLLVNGVFQAFTSFEFRLSGCRNLHWFTGTWVTSGRSFTF